MREHHHVGIVSPNDLAREGLRCILVAQDFGTVTACPSADALEEASRGNPCDVIVVDLVEEADVAARWREARAVFPDARLATIIHQPGMDVIVTAFEAGADGVLMNDISCDQLGSALDLIALGERLLPSRVVDFLVDLRVPQLTGEWETGRSAVKLSDREVEILKCLVAGEANKVIARRLQITEATVKVHIKAILRKLQVLNRTQAAIWAVVRGLSRLEAVPSVPCQEAG